MKKEELEHLKEDEFINFFEKILKKTIENKRRVLWFAVAILMVVLLFVAISMLRKQAVIKDNEVFRQAMVIANSDLLTLDRKIEKLETLHPRRGLSSITSHYLIRLYLQRGDLEKGEALLQQAAQEKYKISRDQQHLLTAGLKIGRGERQEALDIFNRLLSDSKSKIAPDYLLLEIARIYKTMREFDKAREHLNNLLQNHPQSIFRRDAQQMLQTLG